MSIEYERRITVNFATTEDANKVKALARAAGSSPSKWVVRRLTIADQLEKLLVDMAQEPEIGSPEYDAV